MFVYLNLWKSSSIFTFIKRSVHRCDEWPITSVLFALVSYHILFILVGGPEWKIEGVRKKDPVNSRCVHYLYKALWICKFHTYRLKLIFADLKLRGRTKKIFFLFLKQNICCGYSKEPSKTVLLSTQNMLKLMDKKVITILRSQNVFI